MSIEPNLYEWQKENVTFSQTRSSLLIGDDPGLGKTISSIQILKDRKATKILVVCPRVAKGVWKDEIEKFWGVKVFNYVGDKKKRREVFFNEFHPYNGPKVLLVTFALAKEASDIYSNIGWDVVVADEAHFIRNHKTKGWKGFEGMNTKGRIFLTGTPTGRDFLELYGYLKLIEPSTPNYFAWVNKWFGTYPGQHGLEIGPPKNVNNFLKMINQHMIFHRKEDVAKDLPKKIRQGIHIEMTPWQQRVYDELALEGMAELDSPENIVITPGHLTATLRARQLLISPKLLGAEKPSALLEAVQELCEIEANQGTPVVIFTPFAEAIPYIQEVAGSPTYVIKGGMDDEVVRQTVREFQNGSGYAALIVVAKSGSSFTATRAKTAIFAGYEQTAIENIQCEDRIHRIGTKEPVRCLYIIHEGTVDEHILDIVEGKAYWHDLLRTPQKFWKPKRYLDETTNLDE